jgi:hypothetical protein
MKRLANHSIGNYIKDSPETYLWDLVTVKNYPKIISIRKLFPIKLTQQRSGAVVNSIILLL